MARYCSAQDNVRTRQSPPYRETIRVNVLHGRKSMSCAKSVLPLFTGTSSETFRKVPDRVQIDTTLNRQNRVQNHPFIGRHRLLNRTAVYSYIVTPVRPTPSTRKKVDGTWCHWMLTSAFCRPSITDKPYIIASVSDKVKTCSASTFPL